MHHVTCIYIYTYTYVYTHVRGVISKLPNTIYMIKIVNIAEYQDDTIYTTFKYESNPLSIHDHTTLLLNVGACCESQLSIIRYNHSYI